MLSYNGVNDSGLYKDKNSDGIVRNSIIPDVPYTTFYGMQEDGDLKKIKINIYKIGKTLPIENIDPNEISTPLDKYIQRESEEVDNPEQSQEIDPNQGQEGIEPMDTSDESQGQEQSQDGQDGQEYDPNMQGEDPGMGMDAGGGMDMGMGGGMGFGEDPNAVPKPTSAPEVGRIIELKSIFSRMISIETYLSSTFDPKLLKVRELVAEAIELFQIMMANYGLYKDEIDERILSYYKFIERVYTILQKYYRNF